MPSAAPEMVVVTVASATGAPRAVAGETVADTVKVNDALLDAWARVHARGTATGLSAALAAAERSVLERALESNVPPIVKVLAARIIV